MEPTYTILGGDGNQYGPVTAEQFREWARDGRVGAQTQVWRSDTPAWCAAAALPELGQTGAPFSVTPTTPVSATVSDPALEQRLKSGASWFYWIAAMSLINSILVMTDAGISFAIGLGITRETDHALSNAGMTAKAITFAIDLLAAGVVAMFGFFALKKHAWSFIVGMALLALDTGLTVLEQAWLSTAFHVWALISIFTAFKASRALRG